MKNWNELDKKKQISVLVLLLILFAGLSFIVFYGNETKIEYRNSFGQIVCVEDYNNGNLVSEPCSNITMGVNISFLKNLNWHNLSD